MGRKITPTNGHPDHKTARHPKKIEYANLWSNQEENENMINAEHIAEGRNAVEEKKIPGDARNNIKVYHSIDVPKAFLMERRNARHETAKNNPIAVFMKTKRMTFSRLK